MSGKLSQTDQDELCNKAHEPSCNRGHEKSSISWYLNDHEAPTSLITARKFSGSCANLPKNNPSTPSFIASNVPGPALPPYRNLTSLSPHSFLNSFVTSTTYSALAGFGCPIAHTGS